MYFFIRKVDSVYCLVGEVSNGTLEGLTDETFIVSDGIAGQQQMARALESE